MNLVALLCSSDTSLSKAALYALIGFVIVMLVLALLVGIFYLTGALFQTKALSKANLFERKKKTEKQEEVSAEEQDDEQLFAVISAVISAIYDSEDRDDVKPEFVIRRIKKK